MNITKERKTQWVTLNQELAEQLMLLNTRNRPLSRRTVDKYAEMMLGGTWRENGEPIIVTDALRLGSGQHRCQAVIETQISYQCVLVTGVQDDCFDTLDFGKSRNAADVLHISGAQNTTYYSGVLAAIRAFEGGAKSLFQGGVGNHEAIAMKEAYGDISECMSLGDRIYRAIRFPKSIAAGAIYWGIIKDRPKTLRFCEQLICGAGLMPGDPALLLRNRMSRERDSKSKLPRAEIAALFANALLAAIDGKKLGTLKYTSSGPTEQEFPKLVE
jgi:hypothetical protein